jgi:hypothetical protein
MNEAQSIEQFVNELAAALPTGTLRTWRILREVRAHVEEAAQLLRIEGMPEADADLEAVRRFGSVDELVKRFSEEAPLEPENEPMIRNGLSLLVGTTSLYALTHLLFTFIGAEEQAGWWIALKLVAGLAILTQGVLTLTLLWTHRFGEEMPRLVLFLGGMGLVALGSASGVWAAHQGLVTGDWDGYSAVGSLVLVAQGAVTAWVARPNLPDRRPRSAS